MEVLNFTVYFTQTVGNYWVVSAASTLRTMFTKAELNLFSLMLSMILGLVFLKTRQRLLVLFSAIGSGTGSLLVLSSVFLLDTFSIKSSVLTFLLPSQLQRVALLVFRWLLMIVHKSTVGMLRTSESNDAVGKKIDLWDKKYAKPKANIFSR